MDLKTISEDLQIVRMIVSQWAKKYNIRESEYGLVLDKLKDVCDDLGTVPAEDVVYAAAPETPASIVIEDEVAAVPVADEDDADDLPTMSAIERDIVMCEMGELPPEIYEQDAASAKRSEREALKSLYYDEEHENAAPVESGAEKPTDKTLGDIAHEINDTETFNDRYAEELLGQEYAAKQVLGEVINAGAQTVGDSFQAQAGGVVADVTGQTDLRKSIGLNDKYLLVRDLFRGDTELYDKTIGDLDEFDDLDDAMLYIHDNFQWDPNSEGSKLLVELLVNKLQ